MARNKVIDNVRWTVFGAQVSALGAGSSAVQVFTAGNQRNTILRTRGSLVAWLDGTEAPGVSVIVSIGMIMRPGGTGVTITQEPFNDGDADWFYYSEFVLGYEEMVTDVVDVPGITSYREVIDSKAMRKMPFDTEI